MTHLFAAHIAVCGDTLDMSVILPFIDYLPPTVSISIVFKVRIFGWGGHRSVTGGEMTPPIEYSRFDLV